MTQIHKEYERPFVLEPTKLIRLIDIIHERLADQQNVTPHDSFEVFLAGNHREELTNLDDVLALDNSPARKIQRLLITCSASTAGAARPEHEVQVDFASPKTTASGGKTTVVAISARSDNRGWASRTLSEVEEQVERTRPDYVLPVLTLIGILLLMVFILLTQFDSPRSPGRYGFHTMWLHGSDLHRIEALVRDRVITDQELREVVTSQLRNVLEDNRPPQSAVRGGTRQLVLIGVPLAVVFACIIILIATSYPRAVFLWGDQVERHSTMLQRRKILWGVIGTVIFYGLLSRLFFEGVLPWIPRE
jgi:hypothetical protein